MRSPPPGPSAVPPLERTEKPILAVRRRLLFGGFVSAAEPAKSALHGRGCVQFKEKPSGTGHSRNCIDSGIFTGRRKDGRCHGSNFEHDRPWRFHGAGARERRKDHPVSIKTLVSEHGSL